MDILELAQKNLETKFKDNPCRGIFIGLNENQDKVQISWIMGRSPESRNRVYIFENNSLKTSFAHETKVENPKNLFYNAMHEYIDYHIVGNGNQTDDVLNEFEKSKVPQPRDFVHALLKRHCEPDPPIFTPRITGYSKSDKSTAFFSLIKSDNFSKDKWLKTDQSTNLKSNFSKKELMHHVSMKLNIDPEEFPSNNFFYKLNLISGFGYCLTTYKPNNSKDLESFEGEPFVLPAKGSLEEIMNSVWSNLEDTWKVSIAGKFIKKDNSDKKLVIINKYTLEKK